MKGFLKNRIKNNKGFTGVDMTIAIGIFIILVPLVMLVFLNIYTSSQTAKRNSRGNRICNTNIGTS